jgi:site-specific DNA recombinase
MPTVALYARFSSENQSERSVDDQLRLCRERAEREGWTVAGEYFDKAKTGTNLFRPGLQQMLADVQRNKIHIVLAESLDRLSRDLADIASMHRDFRLADTRMVTLAEGDIDILHLAMAGTFSEVFIKNLAYKTRRGLESRVLEGKSGGGKAYGYNIEPQTDHKGNRIGGIWSINEVEANIIRRIAREYLAGSSARTIAIQLNAEGIPGPRGGKWDPSTIYGNRRRGTGILNNERYAGIICWGKQVFRTNPKTGRTNGRLNDESKWIRVSAPELQIYDDETWRRLKAYQAKLDRQNSSRGRLRGQRLFSFLIKCGECGGGMAKVSATQYGCSRARNKGVCENRLTIAEDKLQRIVLGGLRSRLMQPEACQIFCEEYTSTINRLRREQCAAKDGIKDHIADAQRKIEKLMEALKAGVDPALIKDEINNLQAHKRALEISADAKDEAPVFIHPNMAKRFHDTVQRLISKLNAANGYGEAAEEIRSMIEKIVLTPNASRREMIIDLHGDLAGILRVAAGQSVGQPLRLEHRIEEEIDQARLLATPMSTRAAGNTTMVQQNRSGDWLRAPASDQTYEDETSTVGQNGWGGRIRTCECRYQKPVPYHLATPQQP